VTVKEETSTVMIVRGRQVCESGFWFGSVWLGLICLFSRILGSW